MDKPGVVTFRPKVDLHGGNGEDLGIPLFAESRRQEVERTPPDKKDEIVEELGKPFHRNRYGYAINQPFFARLWGVNRLALYDQASGCFITTSQALVCLQN